MVAGRNELLQQAGSLIRSGRLDAAETLCKQALKQNRKDVDALFFLGMIDSRRGEYNRAVRHLETCVKFQPKSAKFLCRLGTALAAQGRFDQAISRYNRTLKLEPSNAAALAGKADALDRRGDQTGAIALLDPIVKSGEEDPNIAYVFANLAVQAGRSKEAVQVALRHVNSELPDPTARRRLYMTLAKAYDKLERYDDAFEAATQGHRTFSIPTDNEAIIRQTDQTIAAFSAQTLAQLPRSNNPSEVPVFVVGMPRTGSTLIEQIIDAHPEACGAGELDAMPNVAAELFGELGVSGYGPQLIEKFDPELVNRYASKYLSRLKQHSRSATRIVDKRLDNVQHVGLIALLFPYARVIFAHRHPLDTCLSCHLQTLAPHKHPYAADLKSLGIMYRQTTRLIRHWRDVLEMPTLDVSYEQLVVEQERISRQLIDFCGLEWDDRCLAFHETGRQARTISYDQVRQPLYQTAVRRHANYTKHLGPLVEALGDCLEDET